jgi:hypothetical protein
MVIPVRCHLVTRYSTNSSLASLAGPGLGVCPPQVAAAAAAREYQEQAAQLQDPLEGQQVLEAAQSGAGEQHFLQQADSLQGRGVPDVPQVEQEIPVAMLATGVPEVGQGRD